MDPHEPGGPRCARPVRGLQYGGSGRDADQGPYNGVRHRQNNNEYNNNENINYHHYCIFAIEKILLRV